uniref:Uncharacterized protein n=1 Tax=Arundo donax TaxID=35708 RepID=A0A0A9CXU0_ARUDO
MCALLEGTFKVLLFWGTPQLLPMKFSRWTLLQAGAMLLLSVPMTNLLHQGPPSEPGSLDKDTNRYVAVRMCGVTASFLKCRRIWRVH